MRPTSTNSTTGVLTPLIGIGHALTKKNKTIAGEICEDGNTSRQNIFVMDFAKNDQYDPSHENLIGRYSERFDLIGCGVNADVKHLNVDNAARQAFSDRIELQ